MMTKCTKCFGWNPRTERRRLLKKKNQKQKKKNQKQKSTFNTDTEKQIKIRVLAYKIHNFQCTFHILFPHES